MKKIVSLLLALCLMCALTVDVFADGVTTLTTTVPSAEYTLTIPEDVEVGYNNTYFTIGDLKATANSGFAEGRKVVVTVDYTEFTAQGVSTTIPWDLKYYCANTSSTYSVTNNKVISGNKLTFTAQSNGQFITASKTAKDGTVTYYSYFKLYGEITTANWGKALAGNYTATITFTSEIVEPSAN